MQIGLGSRIRWRRAAVACAFLSPIAGCGGGYFDGSMSHLDYSGKEEGPASIQVSDPQLYKRENLINERREEYEYLSDLLAKSRTAEFAPELLRDIELVKALSLQLGLSFDAGTKLQFERSAQLSDLEQQIALTKLQMQLAQLQRDLELLQGNLATQTSPSAAPGSATTSTGLPTIQPPGLGDVKDVANRLEGLTKSLTERLDKQSVAPRSSTASVSPRELFQDRQAYRRDIQSAMNSTALDELHDMDGNSLFRLQFRAIVLPGDAADKLGVLQMSVQRPRYHNNAEGTAQFAKVLEHAYLEWLDHVRHRLNETDASGKIRSDPALLQLAAEARLFTTLDLTVPKERAGLPPEPQAQAAQKAPAQDAGPECKMGFFTYIGEPPESCHVFRLAFPAAFGTPAAREMHRMADGFSTTWFEKMQGAREELDRLDRALKAAAPNAALPGTLEAKCSQIASGTDGLVRTSYETARFLAEHASTLAEFQRGYQWAVSALGLNDRLAALVVATRVRIIAFALRDSAGFVAAYRAVQKSCRFNVDADPKVDSTDEKIAVPDDFKKALFQETADGWIAKGRVSTYAVSPVALAQRISTAARAADAIQIAASLAGSLPAQGWSLSSGAGAMRSASGRADVLERVPLVIGYSTPAFRQTDDGKLIEPVFGWLLGPKVVLDSERNALSFEHNLAPYDLTVDISMPGWWPDVQIVSEAAWAPDWKTNHNTVISKELPGSKRIIAMPMRHSKGDLDAVTALLFSNQGTVRVPTPSITRVEPPEISDCVASASFLVRGSNIWRATGAYLLGVPGRNIAVLPDMEGISVTFDIAGLPPGSGTAKLLLTTPDGVAPADISIRGSRVVNNCAVAGKPASGYSITSILPSVIYACDSKLRLLVNGDKEFHPAEVTSVQLGTLPASSFQPLEDGKTLEVLFNDRVDKHGGKQTSMPLVVTTKKGVASKDVTIERDDCAHASSVATASLAVPYPLGPLDVCSKDPALVVAGEGVMRIDNARLVSEVPKLDVVAKSVKIVPAANAAELAFPGVTKAELKDGSLSRVKVALMAGQKLIKTLDVPALCGSSQAASQK